MTTMQAKSYAAGTTPPVLILGPRLGDCSCCSWAATRIDGKDRMYLKQINAMCPYVRAHGAGKAA